MIVRLFFTIKFSIRQYEKAIESRYQLFLCFCMDGSDFCMDKFSIMFIRVMQLSALWFVTLWIVLMLVDLIVSSSHFKALTYLKNYNKYKYQNLYAKTILTLKSCAHK